MRGLSHGLNSDYINEIGIARAVEYELEMIRKTGAMMTRLIIEGNPEKINSEKEIVLFRIILEVLNNSIKHASAKSIEVQIIFENQVLHLSVQDDGKGFSSGQSHDKQNALFGMGIENMQNRAKMINAELEIVSSPGQGTRTSMHIVS